MTPAQIEKLRRKRSQHDLKKVGEFLKQVVEKAKKEGGH